jgi:Flp pilus assembly protein TadG
MVRRIRLQRVRRRRRDIDQCRGAAVVEFAIVVPIFILLIIGFIELGRALMVQQVLTNASRVGARAATMLNSTQAEVIDAVSDYAESVSVPSTQIVVTPDPAAATTGQEVTVSVSVDFSNVSWLPSPWFLNGATLTASSVMRKEGFN